MNKYQYKLVKRIERYFQKYGNLAFVEIFIKSSLAAVRMQVFSIMLRQYHEKDTPCWSKNNPNDEWKEDVIPANKESKEIFEQNKQIEIAEAWINYIDNIARCFSMTFENKNEDKKKYFKRIIEIIKSKLNKENE